MCNANEVFKNGIVNNVLCLWIFNVTQIILLFRIKMLFLKFQINFKRLTKKNDKCTQVSTYAQGYKLGTYKSFKLAYHPEAYLKCDLL